MCLLSRGFTGETGARYLSSDNAGGQTRRPGALQFAQSAPHPTLGFWATGLLLGYAAMRLIAGPAGTDLVPGRGGFRIESAMRSKRRIYEF